MADGLTTQSATPATIPASTVIATDDAGASGHVQIIKLAQSADGSATPVTVDADGVLVNLGANNDVTVSDGGGSLTVDATSLPLPTGASTLAEQQSQTTHLATIAGDTTNIETSVQLIDDAIYTDGAGTPTKAMGIAGTDGTNPQIIKTDTNGELQVDVLSMPTTTVTGTVTVTDGSGSLTVDGTITANLAAGTNNIGDVDILSIAAGDNNIGNVDIASAIPAGDNAIGRVKITDGTETALVDASGYLMVNVAAGGVGDGSILDGSNSAIKATVLDYTNANPVAVRLTDTNGDYVGAGAGTQYTEDAAAAANPVGNALILVRDDAISGSLTTADGDNVAARGNNKGELYVKHTDAIPVTDNGGSLTVDATSLPLPTGASTSANQTTIIGHLDGVEGLLTTIDADTGNVSAKIDTIAGAVAGTEMQVDIVTMPNVTLAAGTNTNEVVGDVAQDAPVAGNPLLIGGRASAAAPTDMSADGDAVHIWTTLKGAVNVADAGGTLSIDDGGGNISIDDGGNTITVDGTVSVTGVATLAEQQTQTTHLATIAGDTTNIETSVQLIDDTVATLGTTTYTETSTKGLIVGAVRRDADTTLVDTTNEVGPLQMDANGRLKVEVFSGETLPVSLASVPSHAVTNAGTFAVQVDGSALTALQLIDDPVVADDAGFTPGTTKVMVAGFEADETATDSVDEGDAGAARMTLDRKQIVNPQPHTTGGLSTFMASGSDGSTALTSTAQAVKASAGMLYGYYIYNPNTSAQFIHFYNTAAASVTVGTTNPLFTLTIPPTSAANLSLTMGIEFSNAGWSISATSTAGGNGAPTTALDAVVWYK